MAVVFCRHFEIVFVDERSACCGAENPEGDRDEHEAGDAGRVALSALVDDGEGDEEHVEEAVKNGHVD